MPKILRKYLCFLLISIVIISCGKDPAAPDIYFHTAANSTWSYQQANNAGPAPVFSNYVVTSTNRDTTAMGKTYHIYTRSTGGNQYYNETNGDYYQLDSLKIATAAVLFDRLYLKDEATVGTNWAQSLTLTIPGIPFPIPVTVTSSIAEKDISRTVNGIAYSGVIRVSTTLSSSLIPSASFSNTISSYYARRYGLIENSTVIALNFMGFVQNINTSLRLMSSDLR